MIVAQRNYQSNAQTIKTQDSILNTLVNLRRLIGAESWITQYIPRWARRAKR